MSTTSSVPGSAVVVADGMSFRARVVRFYQRYNPSKLADVDDILSKYAGRETEVLAALKSKYGPEPPAPSVTAPPPAVVVSMPSGQFRSPHDTGRVAGGGGGGPPGGLAAPPIVATR